MKKKYEIISFHPGKSHNFDQAEQICRYFKDFKTITSIYLPPSIPNFLSRFSKKIGNQVFKRSYRFSRPDIVMTYPNLEIERFIKAYLNLSIDWLKRTESFQKWVVKKFYPPKVALGFDSGSRIVFRAWKGKSFCILDLGIAIPQYRVKVLKGDQFTVDDLKREPIFKQELFDRYSEELELADLILCGSDFVKASCLEFGIDENKLKVLPYGVDVDKFNNPGKIYNRSSDSVHLVFIGAFGYRKGGDILLKVWRRIKTKYPDSTLTVLGSVQLDVEEYKGIVDFKGHVSQNELIDICLTKDVLVFPTSFEGSSLSIYQAMAMKLAVVTTFNSGSVIENGKSGLIVEYGREDVLYDAIEQMIVNPEVREKYAEEGYKKVQGYTWNDYGDKLRLIIKEALNEQL